MSSKEVESRRSTWWKSDFTKGGNTLPSKRIEQNNRSKREGGRERIILFAKFYYQGWKTSEAMCM